jgi:Protein of unknown function (DUF2695)
MDEDQRHLKKQWLAEQKAVARAAFPAPAIELEAFFHHVAACLAESGCDHSLRFTSSWLAQRGLDRERVLDWLVENGGFCDCEVVATAKIT